MHGIPFIGCSKKLKGLLSIITTLERSLCIQDKSFTCSLYSLQYKDASLKIEQEEKNP